MLRKIAILAAAILMVAGASQAAPSPDVKDTARTVDEHYNQLKTLKSDFTEIYESPGFSRTESGTLWLKKPGKMRWEYRQPREKLFLSDSQTAYFYVPGDRQARKTSVRKLDDIRSPLRYLLGKTKLEKELDGLSFAPDVQPLEPGDVVMRGVPKALKDRVSDTLIEVSPAHRIVRIVIQELDGTKTDFRFSRFEEDIPVQDSLFRFNPPPDVETITDEHVTQ